MPARFLENHEPLPANVAGVARMLILGLLLITCLAPANARAQTALFRVNAGGDAQAPLNGGVGWDVDTAAAPSAYHVAGSNVAAFAGGTFHPSVPAGTPPGIFDTERWDPSGGDAMQWNFPVGSAGTYEVRLYFKNGYTGTSTVGTRVFNVLIEGVPVLTNYDIIADVGHQVAIMKSFVVTSDANLDIDFQHVVENPLINGIEIVAVSTEGYLLATPSALDFGMVEVGTPAALPLTLRNLGSTTGIAIDPFTVATDFQASFGGMVLAPGASTVVMVTFDPAIGSGATQESLAITHGGSNSPLGVPLSGFSFDPGAAPIAFNGHTLGGTGSNNPTSLEFGPDGRLYVSQQDGLIKVYTIARNDNAGTISYTVTATETISVVQAIPNHNDDGSAAPGITTRQVTGLAVAGDAANPVIYVGSSDPRIAVNNDSGLDTNSGIISRLTWTGSAWDHVQLVRGLPRSEENHSTNGLDLDEAANVLYVMQGGNTNKGAPSNNFSRCPEYALSAALLTVDLDMLAALPVLVDGFGNQYVLDLATIDDPTRPGSPDANDPFGGNNGLNQAIWDPTGPVQVHSPGYRNAYDVVLTQNGRLYTFDNGPNGGWGGLPVNEGTVNVTNEANEAGDTGYGDQLQFISGQGFYGGHPNPTRANPTGSDIFTYQKISGTWTLTGTYDWLADFPAPPVPAALANPAEGTYLVPGADSSLFTVGASTNGICEYTAGNFGGQMTGQLLAASFNGNVIRFKLNGAGTMVLESANVGNLATPLDVTAQGDFAVFPGTIWSADHGSSTISVYEPVDFGGGGGACTGANVSNLDEDNDGFSNADEIANGTNPCASGSFPADADGDQLSDLIDPDDDNDGLPDTNDPFAIDPDNGLTTGLPVNYTFSINAGDQVPGTFFELGFTGLMSNGATDYRDQFDTGKLAAGGAAGFFTVEDVPTGDAYQAGNSQQYAFQFGIAADTSSPPFTAHTRLQPPFFGGVTPTNYQSFGLQLGTGHQDNYLKIVLTANGGAGGVQVLLEQAGVATEATYGVGVTGNVLAAGTVDLYADVNPAAATVQPRLSIDGGTTVIDLGSPLAIPATWLAPADDRGLAVGIIATSFGSPTPFNATWDLIEVTGPASNASAALTVTAGAGLNASTYSGNSFLLSNTSPSGQKLTRAIIDLGSGLINDMAFDPAGTAGDLTAKPFTVDTNPGVGTISHALSVPRGSGGFEVLTIDFAGGAFDAGETFGFSIDVDPTSIQGVGAPGPGDSGSVSGLELVGATITAQFSDGSSRTASLWSDGSLGGGTATLNQTVAPAPGLAVVGLTPPVSVGSAAQTVRITGPAGATARLLLVEAALFEQPGGGVDIQPFEANCAIARQEITGIVLNGSGSADVTVTMVKSNPDGGLFHLIAVLNGTSVLASPTLVVEVGAFISAVDGSDELPSRVELAGAYPNPFNPATTIAFSLPGNLQVSLGIYDVQGRLVRALVDGVLPAGRHDIAWDGLDRTGRAVGSGTYLYRLQAGDLSATRKITLVK
ncbi:MAG: T9SS type A sorting domain-containing protein [bacterium]|nr:T9SS type A sorting domain-containing protein [bacterium]